MLTTVALLASAFQADAKPAGPTVLDLLKNVHVTYRKLGSFRDEWTFVSKSEPPRTSGTKVLRAIDGKRFHLQWINEGKTVMEEAYDGDTHMMVSHAQGVYMSRQQAPPVIEEKFEVAPPHEPTNTFDFRITGFEFEVWLDPWPTFKKESTEIVDKEKLRRFDYETGRTTKGRMTVWFEEKDWIVRRLELVGKDSEGKRVEETFIIKVTRGPLGSTPFTIPAAAYQGYQRISGQP